jgi:hypothetical protein
MPWKERNGRLYFYRNRRKGDTVVSEYIGHGEKATQIALQIRAKVELERRLRDRESQERYEQELIDNTIDAIGQLVNSYTGAHLLATGHHQHKRQWRKQYGK